MIILFKIFKRKRKYQGLSDSRPDEASPEITEGERNREKNGIFDEYYEWESTYCGDDFPNFDDYLEYKNWIEGIEREKDSDTEGDKVPSGKDKEF